MTWIILIAFVVAVALLLLANKNKSQQGSADEYPYVKNEVLFSPAERSFLGVLVQAIGENYTVCGKVRVADVVSVKSTPNKGAWQRAFNRISAKHFDFVVCAKGDLSIICVIELDDQSHRQRKRRERDAFLVEVCRAASLPFIQVPAQQAYSVIEIQSKFLEILKINQPVPQKPSTEEHSPVESTAVDKSRASNISDPETQKSAAVEAGASAPTCPKCAAPMVHREVKSGSKAGQKFWGCSTFPKCRGVMVNP